MAFMLCMGACTPVPAAQVDNKVPYDNPTEILSVDGEPSAFTNEIMGCMMMRECIEDVKEVKSIQDIEWYQKRLHSEIGKEFNEIVSVLNDLGIKVFIAPEKYFPIGNRGVYYTKGNTIFLNTALVKRSSALISVLRHEGWHGVQDCMAGEIGNNMIAIVFDEEKIPGYYTEVVGKTYSDGIRDSSIPWEKEAWWAANTHGMTIDALKVCRDGVMWDTYPPTPLTKRYLLQEGYMSK